MHQIFQMGPREGAGVVIATHSLTLKTGTSRKCLDAALLSALQNLAWTPPGDSLRPSRPQLRRQLAYAICLVASFADIVLDAQNRV